LGTNGNCNPSLALAARLERVALAVGEQRLALELSLNGVARVAGVSRTTVTKVEWGRPVSPVLLLRVAWALAVLELYAPPAPEPARPGPGLDEELRLGLVQGVAA
jgi:DNA-binding XRE family transcriptional regulator